MRFVKMFILLIVMVLTGCAVIPGTPGYVSVSQSEFDKTTQISMQPVAINDWSTLTLGMTWRSDWEKDEFVLEAATLGAKSIVKEKSLFFNIDGKIYDLTSIDATTDYYVNPMSRQGFSFKRYNIKKELVEKIISAKDIKVRLVLDKEFSEGSFYAKSTFVGFLNEYNKINNIKH